MAVYKGPVRPGESESIFRETGRTVREVRGPVRPGTDVETFRRGGSGSSGGSSRNTGAQAQAAIAAAQKAAEAAKIKAAEEQRIREAKDFAEKTRIAREIVETKKGKADFKRILDQRTNLIKRGIIERTIKSRDVKTGDILEVSQWRDKTGNRVQRIVNKNKGTTSYSSYAKGRRTGGVSMETTPTAKETPSVIAKRDVKVVASEVAGKKLVILKDGQKFRISESGRVVIGAAIAGNKLTFQDGKLVMLNDRWVDGREIFEPFPTVTAIEQPTGIIATKIKKLNDLRKVKVTSSIRNQQRKIKNELAVLGVVAATVVIGGVQGVVALGAGILKIIRDPRKITKVPKKILEGGTALITAAGGIGQMIRISPTEAIAVIAGEYILLRGTGTVLKIVGKLPGSAKALIRPALNKADKTRFTVNGNTIKLAGGTASTAESLAKQAARAGRKSVPVTALSDDIFGLIKRKEIVRKPIPGENLLSIKTKKLLKKFDAGKASKTEMIKLDKLIQIETRGAGSLLERATFADPAGRVRTSRLGLETQKDASLLDILSGDFTFRANKPQIFVFDKIVIEAFPASLKIIARKFKAGKTLTTKETAALLKFQLKKSGKWKPIGAVSKESEIVLAPGELIKRVKTVGHVNIGGKRIPVVNVKVVKASGNLKILMKKFEMKKISAVELRRLQKLLNSKTGFKNRIYRSGNSRPVVRFPGLIGRRSGVPRAPGRRVTKRPPKRKIQTKRRPTVKPSRKSTKRPTPRKSGSPRRTPSQRLPKRTIGRPPKRPPKRPPRRVTPRPPVKTPVPIPLTIPKGFKKRRLTKKAPVYFVVIKRRGKLIRLTPKPMILKDARDYGAYRTDHGLSRSFWFEPMGASLSVVGLPLKMKNYYLKHKSSFRPYKINRGRKLGIRHGYIEKAGASISTKGEKVALRKARLLTKRKKGKVVRSRPIFPSKALSKLRKKKSIPNTRLKRKVSKTGIPKIKKRVVKRRLQQRGKTPVRKKRTVKRRLPKKKNSNTIKKRKVVKRRIPTKAKRKVKITAKREPIKRKKTVKRIKRKTKSIFPTM